MFNPILKPIARTDVERMVKDINAPFRSKGLSSWSPFVGMVFCLLGRAHSLREIEGALKHCEGKPAHLGICHAARTSRSSSNRIGLRLIMDRIPGQDLAKPV